ncbi:hypothetical protein HGP16_02815 [Rhizobium sp. P40RR-XXII]|nr:hypothetical protein [Rhizobium sp. P40RR-XXII]
MGAGLPGPHPKLKCGIIIAAKIRRETRRYVIAFSGNSASAFKKKSFLTKFCSCRHHFRVASITDHSLLSGLNHIPNFDCFFEVIQTMRFDPPLGRFHEQGRIIIPVGEKCIERQPDGVSLLLDLVIAD